MKIAIALAVLLASGFAAQAKLTPFDGTREAQQPADVMSLYTGPVAAQLEQNYFQAPEQAYLPGRCTVSTFVFSKISLSQACY